MKALIAAFLVLSTQAGTPATAPAPTDSLVLTFGLYQSDKPTELYKKFTPILEVLQDSVETNLGRSTSIELVIHKTYEEAIDALAKGEVDFVRFGPASYVLSKQKEKNVKLLAIEEKKGARLFPGVIVVRGRSTFRTLSDVAGHSFAFGDANSTIGRYLAQAELLKVGVSAKELSNFEYLGRHDKVAKAVDLGDFDAGSLKKSTFDKMNEDGHMRVLYQFQNITKPWIARSGMERGVFRALQNALINMDDEESLAKLKISGFGKVKDVEYKFIRDAIKTVKKRF